MDFYVTSRWPPVLETAVRLAVSGGVFDGVFLCCPFPPLDVLDEIWVIESVSGEFLTYSYKRRPCSNGNYKNMRRGLALFYIFTNFYDFPVSLHLSHKIST